MTEESTECRPTEAQEAALQSLEQADAAAYDKAVEAGIIADLDKVLESDAAVPCGI